MQDKRLIMTEEKVLITLLFCGRETGRERGSELCVSRATKKKCNLTESKLCRECKTDDLADFKICTFNSCKGQASSFFLFSWFFPFFSPAVSFSLPPPLFSSTPLLSSSPLFSSLAPFFRFTVEKLHSLNEWKELFVFIRMHSARDVRTSNKSRFVFFLSPSARFACSATFFVQLGTLCLLEISTSLFELELVTSKADSGEKDFLGSRCEGAFLWLTKCVGGWDTLAKCIIILTALTVAK